MTLTYTTKSETSHGIFFALFILIWGSLLLTGIMGWLLIIKQQAVFFQILFQVLLNNSDFVFEHGPFLSMLLVGLITATVIFALFEMFLLTRLAAEIVVIVIFGSPIVLTVLGALVLTQTTGVGLIIMVIGLIFLLIVFFFRKRIIFGAKLFEFAAEAAWANKRTLIPNLFYALITTLMVFLWMGFMNLSYTLSEMFYNQGLAEDPQSVAGILVSIGSFLYLFFTYALLFFSDGTQIIIFHKWLNNEADISLSSALHDVWMVRGTIALFAFALAVLRRLENALERFLRRTPFVGVVRFFFGIIRFLNYYTLPIIVIEKRGLEYSVKKSVRTVGKSFIEIFAGAVGISIANMLFRFITFVIFGVVGFFLGTTFISQEFGLGFGFGQDSFFFERVIVGLISAFIFVVFGFLPLNIILNPITVAYKTVMLNVAAAYMEGRGSSDLSKTRLPPDLIKRADEIFQSSKVQAALMRDRELIGELG